MINHRLARFVLGVLLLNAVVLSAYAQALFQEGTHYQRLPQAAPAGSGERPEVVELFSHNCIHCFNFKPAVQEWLQTKPDDVEFIRIPVTFGRRDMELLARAYYAAQELGITDQADTALYDAFHVQRRRLNSVDAIAELFAELGVEREAFDRAFNSFAVETKVRRANQLIQRYQVRGTPSMVINGQYLTTGSMAGSNPRMLDVADFLTRRYGAPAVD